MNAISFLFKKSLYLPVELYDLGKRLWNVLKPKLSQDPRGVQVIEDLQSALTTLNAATEREKANPLTAKIHEEDRKRDNILLMIRDTIKGNTHNALNNEAKTAAQVLFKLFNDHVGNIYAMGYGSEGKAVQYFLESLETNGNKERCSLIGIDRFVEGLKESQLTIENLCAERTRLEPELDQYFQKNAMQSAINAIRRTIGYVDILTAGNDPEFAGLGADVQNIIADVETIARSRRTRIENNAAKEPEEGTENKAA
jgi:hypothetical protein